MNSLLSPRALGRLQLKNALAVAPMTTTQSHADGSVSEAEARWLERLADDGYGLVLTCAAAISRTSIAFPQQLSFGDDAFLPGLTKLAERVGRPGMAFIAQLCHGGSRALPDLTGEPAQSASRFVLPLPGFVPPMELSPAQIRDIVKDFAQAALRASKAGFQGVEFHGANGYLFTQFLSTVTNLRKDEWGGSLVNRARLAREVVRATRAAVPVDFIVGMRWSFEGPFDASLDIDEGIQVMNWLKQDGLDYGHISHLNFAAASSKYAPEPALSLIRKGVDPSLPLMAAGSVRTAADLERAQTLGADFVAIGRGAIGNTEVPAKLARGEALVETPFERERLATQDVSLDFIRYLTTAPPLASLHIVAD